MASKAFLSCGDVSLGSDALMYCDIDGADIGLPVGASLAILVDVRCSKKVCVENEYY